MKLAITIMFFICINGFAMSPVEYETCLENFKLIEKSEYALNSAILKAEENGEITSQEAVTLQMALLGYVQGADECSDLTKIYSILFRTLEKLKR